ncbi:hypothetical protein ACWC3X_32590 [Streptomyces populi]
MTVDMKEYSQLPEAKMAPARADLDSMLTTVLAHCGIGNAEPLGSAVKDRGDGAVFVLPARHAARLVDPLLVRLAQALERREQTRLASAPTIRLRASVHVGPLAPPDHRADAVNDACRLVDSDAARHALTAAMDHGVLLAAAVSDTVFRRTVAAGRTPVLQEHHFQRATARVEGKPRFEQTCWLFVPGLVPSVLAPYLTAEGSGTEDRPRQDSQHNAKDTADNTSKPSVRQKGKASGKARLIQVGGNYTTGAEQS